MHSIVKIEGLSHSYGGNRWAIRDINLEIDKTGVVGLLGSNGAGKSTTMNILCGVLNQTKGQVYIQGIDTRLDPELARRDIGFLPQQPPLYPDLTVGEYLRYAAQLRRIDKQRITSAIDEAMDRCGISHFRTRLLRNLSGGYKQRVGIAQAIIHHPKLVVMNEPTTGLDPNQLIEARKLIREIGQEHTVLLSSHILSEVHLLCRDVVMIESGRVIFSDSMDAFDNYVQPHSLLLRLENPPSSSALLQVPGVVKVDFLNDKEIRIYFDGDESVAERVAAASSHHGWQLREIQLEKSQLDDIFKQLSTQNPS